MAAEWGEGEIGGGGGWTKITKKIIARNTKEHRYETPRTQYEL